MTRNAALRRQQSLLMKLGVPYRRYAKKFIEQFGTYDNPYLGETEHLDLRTTYVPLSVQIANTQTVAFASDVLGAAGDGRAAVDRASRTAPFHPTATDQGTGQGYLRVRCNGLGCDDGAIFR